MSDHGFAELSERPQASASRPEGSSPRPGSSAAIPRPTDQTVISRPAPLVSPEHPSALPDFREQLGTQLGHFRIEGFVGGGGMGAVFRGRDGKLDRPVAIKVLAHQQGQDDELVRRFQNEARSAARLDHENIARVYDFGTDRGWHYIVFEFVDGRNVRDLVTQSGPLDIPTALAYVRQIAEALQHAAERDVVHRDVKPSNIVITGSGRAKLVDMGLARLLQVERSGEDLTASGVTLGTFDYISPEQARDPRLVDVRSDIYSLGCTLFFMLTGAPPFPHGSAVQKLLSHSNDPPPDPRQYRSDIPDEVVWILQRMLAKNAEDRYQQPQEIIADIAIICQQYALRLPGPVMQVVVRSEAAPGHWWDRHLVWIAPLLVLCALIVSLEWLDLGRSSGNLVIPPLELGQQVAAQATGAPDPSLPAAGNPDQVAGQGPGEPTAAPTQSARSTDGSRSASDSTGAAGSGPDPSDPSPPSEGSAGGTGSGHPLGPFRTPRPDWSELAANGPFGNPRSTPAKSASRIIVAPHRTDDSGEEVVTSLSMAIDMVRRYPIHRIELHYDGLGLPGMDLQDPLELRGLDVTLAAGPGYHPVVRYRPMGDALLEVQNSRLHVEGVHFEMEFPPDAMAGGTIFKLHDARALTLANCTFTVHMADQATAMYTPPEATIIDAYASQPAAPEGRAAEYPAQRLQIQMSDCIVRGEAVLVRSLEAVPMDIVWRNGLIISTQRMFRLGGASRRPDLRDLVRIELQHLTAHLLDGLCLMTTDRVRPYHLPVELDVTDSILIGAGSAGPGLVRQSGVLSRQAFEDQLEYRGERNFYEKIAVFWQIEASGQGVPSALYFQAWKEHWKAAEQSPHYQEVQWAQFPSTSLPLAERLPSDYMLDDSLTNPALRSGPDMASAGADLTRLPKIVPGGVPASDPSL